MAGAFFILVMEIGMAKAHETEQSSQHDLYKLVHVSMLVPEWRWLLIPVFKERSQRVFRSQ